MSNRISPRDNKKPKKVNKRIDLDTELGHRKKSLTPLKEKKKHFRQWLEEDDDQEDIILFEKSEEE